MGRNPTLKDVAEVCGVSVPTVSGVLGSRRELFRPETCASVEAAAKRVGYRPNGAAVSLREKRFGAVGLALSAEAGRSALVRTVLDGIHSELEKNDLHLTIGRIHDETPLDVAGPESVPKVLRQWSCDGLLVNYKWFPPPWLIDLVDSTRLPAVWVASKHEYDAVYPDLEAAFALAVQRLAALGHERIACVSPPTAQMEGREPHYSMADAAAGYRNGMNAAGLEPTLISRSHVPHRWDDEARDSWTCIRHPDTRPTAIVAHGYPTANAVMHAVHWAGLRVPQDISIVCVGVPASGYLGIRMTQVALPSFETGARSVRMLVQKIKEPARRIPADVLPARWVDGDTVLEKEKQP